MIEKLFSWEAWHHHVKYIPLVPVWLWHCIKARSFWFFTASNPTITFGGFEGEGKMEMYNQLPGGSYPKSIVIEPGIATHNLQQQITGSGFTYPYAVKPDIGMMGFMFRIINNETELYNYHASMPKKYIVQELITYPLEVSVFYFRMPNETKGTVSGFLQKCPPTVTGNGKSSLRQLILSQKDLKFVQEDMLARHKNKLEWILPLGEVFTLSFACNRSQGGKLKSLAHEIDGQLRETFDKISCHAGYFYYGRYDVKCNSVAELKAGKNFSILEFNGAGAGVQHIYGNNLSLWQAMKTILVHWRMLYKISVYNNRKKGVKFWEFTPGLKFLRAAKQNLMFLKGLDEKYPPSENQKITTA